MINGVLHGCVNTLMFALESRGEKSWREFGCLRQALGKG